MRSFVITRKKEQGHWQQRFCREVLKDLSKAFETLNHELLIAQVHAYGFGKDLLMLLLSYLSNRWQRTKINASFTSWMELIQGVRQGSVVGPSSFNIYLNNDLFSFLDFNVWNFADDTTPFTGNKNLGFVLNELERNSNIAIDWFQNNYMNMNSDKCHLLVAGHKFEQIWAKIGTDLTWESNSVKLRPATPLKRLWRRCFPVNFVKFLRTPFLQNTSGRLLPNLGFIHQIWFGIFAYNLVLFFAYNLVVFLLLIT